MLSQNQVSGTGSSSPGTLLLPLTLRDDAFNPADNTGVRRLLLEKQQETYDRESAKSSSETQQAVVTVPADQEDDFLDDILGAYENEPVETRAPSPHVHKHRRHRRHRRHHRGYRRHRMVSSSSSTDSTGTEEPSTYSWTPRVRTTQSRLLPEPQPQEQKPQPKKGFFQKWFQKDGLQTVTAADTTGIGLLPELSGRAKKKMFNEIFHKLKYRITSPYRIPKEEPAPVDDGTAAIRELLSYRMQSAVIRITPNPHNSNFLNFEVDLET